MYISKYWENFFPNFSLEIGDGATISFWHNQWIGEGLLKDLFPGLYALVLDRNTSVPHYRVQGSDNSVWMLVFVLDMFVDDDTLLRFFSKLKEANLANFTTDEVRLKLNTKGCFTVRSFYLKLLHLNYSASEILCERGFPCQLHMGRS